MTRGEGQFGRPECDGAALAEIERELDLVILHATQMRAKGCTRQYFELIADLSAVIAKHNAPLEKRASFSRSGG